MSSELVPPGLTYLAGNVASKQNILGVSKEQQARWAKGLDLPKQAETVFFAGCGYQFTRQLEMLMSLVRKLDRTPVGAELPIRFSGYQKKIGVNLPEIYGKLVAKGADADARPLKDAVKVLRHLGMDIGYLADEEPCCGATLYNAGLHEEFARNARQAHQKLKAAGVKRIISIVPYCTHALKELFPGFVDGYDIEVKHFLEVVTDSISSLKLRFPRRVRITYHDSCQLVRYLGLIDEPRRILNSIENIELVEPEWTKGKWATCCGGGGGFEAVFPSMSHILAVNRAKELLETGAEIIVTHCPGCTMQLESGLKELKADNVKVLDLTQIIAAAME